MAAYNGQSAVIRKIEELLGKKTISPSVATRLLLESYLESLKHNHDLVEEVKEIKKNSWGYWASQNPKKFFALVIILNLYLVSDFRHPLMNYASGLIEALRLWIGV